MKTYAQNYEDVRLWKALGHVRLGRYVDIGAQDPVHDSVSRLFYERGWRGVHVDPMPQYAAALREARPDEIVIEAAVSASQGPLAFYAISESGLSTGLPNIASEHVKAGWCVDDITVDTTSLASIFDKIGEGPIHWLKIDVEGMEKDVLASWADHPQRPWILIIESTFPMSQRDTHGEWIDLAVKRGYRDVCFDGLSRFLVHENHMDLADKIAQQINVFDGFQVQPRHFSTIELEAHCAAREAAIGVEHAARAATLEAERREAGLQAEVTLSKLHVETERRLNEVRAEAERRLHEAYAEVIAERSRATETESRLNDQIARQTEMFGEERNRHTAALYEQQRASDRQLLRAVEEFGKTVKLVAEDKAEALRRADMASQKLAMQLEEALESSRAFSLENARTASELAVMRSKLERSVIDVAEANERLEEQRVQNSALHRQVGEQADVIARIRDELSEEQIRYGAVNSLLQRRIDRLEDLRRSTHSPLVKAIAALVPSMRRIRTLVNAGFDDSGNEIFHIMNQQAPAYLELTQSYIQASSMKHSRNPYHRANDLDELCEFSDIDFVRCAYVTMLGRQPDMAGERYYLRRIRAGHAKMEVLWQLRRSAEGKRHDPGIAGLDRSLKRAALCRRPLVGSLIRLIAGGEGDSAHWRLMRKIDNQLGMSGGSTSRAGSDAMAAIEKLSATVEWVATHLHLNIGEHAIGRDQILQQSAAVWPEDARLNEGELPTKPLDQRASEVYARLR